MPPHTLKTVAAFIAVLGVHGLALAQTSDAIEPVGGFVVDDYYLHMDRQYAQFTKTLLASAHARMHKRFASIDHPPRYSGFTGGFAGIHVAP